MVTHAKAGGPFQGFDNQFTLGGQGMAHQLPGALHASGGGDSDYRQDQKQNPHEQKSGEPAFGARPGG